MHPMHQFSAALAAVLLSCLSPVSADEPAEEVARRLDYWKDKFPPVGTPPIGVTNVPITIGGQNYTLEIRVTAGGTKPTTGQNGLLGQLRAAYKDDMPADAVAKEKGRKALADVYTRMVAAVASPDVRTLGQVQERLKMETNNALPVDVLPKVRRVIQDHLATTIPGDSTSTLTPEGKTRIAAVFTNVASALAQLQ